MSGKEVGHDKKRSLVMPMGLSSWELPGNARGEVVSIGRALLESNWKPRALRL
jgi:hypothetical protein